MSSENIVLQLKGKLSRKTIYKALAYLTKKGLLIKKRSNANNSFNLKAPRVFYELARPSNMVHSQIDFLNAVWKPLIHKTSRKEKRRLKKIQRKREKLYINTIINGEIITNEQKIIAISNIAKFIYHSENYGFPGGSGGVPITSPGFLSFSCSNNNHVVKPPPIITVLPNNHIHFVFIFFVICFGLLDCG